MTTCHPAPPTRTVREDHTRAYLPCGKSADRPGREAWSGAGGRWPGNTVLMQQRALAQAAVLRQQIGGFISALAVC